MTKNNGLFKQESVIFLVIDPALSLYREFHSVRGDDHCSYVWFGEVADHVECLEVVTELVVLADRDSV